MTRSLQAFECDTRGGYLYSYLIAKFCTSALQGH